MGDLAAAGGRDGLNRRRSNPILIWSKRLIVLGALGAAGTYGYQALRASGFQFRWERGAVVPTTTDPATGRPLHRVPTATGASGSVPEPTAGGGSAAATPDDRAAADDSRLVSTVLEPPFSLDADLPPPGSGDPVTIDFESFPDGTPSCAPCEVADEWSSAGLRLSFRSWTASATEPTVLDGRDYLPPGSAQRALGPSFREEVGLEVGVIRLDFPGRPRTVSFSLFGPDIVSRFAITAWSGGRILESAVDRAHGRTYDPGGRGLFREEIITVRAASGIDRVSLDGWGPPGHMLLVDDLVITP